MLFNPATVTENIAELAARAAEAHASPGEEEAHAGDTAAMADTTAPSSARPAGARIQCAWAGDSPEMWAYGPAPTPAPHVVEWGRRASPPPGWPEQLKNATFVTTIRAHKKFPRTPRMRQTFSTTIPQRFVRF
jgi:hypothetical protein